MSKQDFANKYPKVFSNPSECRFECPEGWFKLLDKLCSELNEYLDPNPEIKFNTVLIKSKFAGMRFHYFPWNQDAQKIIDKYENMSMETCEECGEPGKIVTINYWNWCLCNNCKERMLNAR